MRAMVLERPCQPLRLRHMPRPRAGPGQLLIKVSACAVCRTDLHIVDGDLSNPKSALVPGHEIIGHVFEIGPGVEGFEPGDRVGVPWLGHVCGRCQYCRSGAENLCPEARFTGYHIDGGFAEFTAADAGFCFAIPDKFSDVEAAPLMCAGLIGYRSLAVAGDAERIGLYGFGAAAHIIAQLAKHQGREIFAFTRPGDAEGQNFARDLGADWVGDSTAMPPRELDAAIIFAPVGALAPIALKAVRAGGTVVCAGIHMSDIPSFPYALLWGERCLRSVANLTRRDGEEFLKLAAGTPLKMTTREYRLEHTNRALDDLRNGRFKGAAVIVPQ